MQAFICSFSDFSLAVPMDAVLSLDDASGIVSKKEALLQNAVFRDPHGTYVCLPLLLRLAVRDMPHCIVLKKTENGEPGNIILLSTKITGSDEIHDREICRLPKVLEGTGFYALFSGIRRMENGAPLLMLDIAGLRRHIQKEGGN